MSINTLQFASEAPPGRALKINDVLESLHLAPGRLSEDDLERVVSAVSAHQELFDDLVATGEDGQWWTLLYRTPSFELRLLTWKHDEVADWHDHGGSSGVYGVTKGALIERYRGSDAVSIKSRTLYTGYHTTFGPDHIHDIAVRDDRPTVSLHAYSPPLSGMTYYDHTEFGFVAQRFVAEAERVS
jgi:hypothetical protein